VDNKGLGILLLLGVGAAVIYYILTSEEKPTVRFFEGRFPPLSEQQFLRKPLRGYEYLVTP